MSGEGFEIKQIASFPLQLAAPYGSVYNEEIGSASPVRLSPTKSALKVPGGHERSRSRSRSPMRRAFDRIRDAAREFFSGNRNRNVSFSDDKMVFFFDKERDQLSGSCASVFIEDDYIGVDEDVERSHIEQPLPGSYYDSLDDFIRRNISEAREQLTEEYGPHSCYFYLEPCLSSVQNKWNCAVCRGQKLVA